MIISIEKAKELVNLGEWTDSKIDLKLRAIEKTIRAHTNYNFQNRGLRIRADIIDGEIISDSVIPFEAGDTIEIHDAKRVNGLYTVNAVSDAACTVSEDLKDEIGVMITKVEYPEDVIVCCLNLLEWEYKNRSKVGVKSETLSRHSVTYYDQDATNQLMGYPVSLLGCLKPYRKFRC